MNHDYEIVRPGQEHHAAMPGYAVVLDADGEPMFSLWEGENFTDEQIRRIVSIFRGARSLGYLEGLEEKKSVICRKCDL
jgi:hypothetical protein